MIREGFSLGHSFIHRLDPRVKLVIAILFSIVVAVADRFTVLLSGLLFSLIVIAMARLKIREVFYRLLVVNGFILLLWIFLPFTFPGDTLFSIGRLTASREGVIYSLLITIKSNTIILSCIALIATSSITTLVHAMRHLYVPDKLVHLFFFCYRYIHVIHLEYTRLLNAMRIRCFTPKTNIHTYRTYAHLVAMLLLKSYDRSERVYNAMLCRGFKGNFWMLDHFSLKGSDLISGTVMLLYIVGLVFLQWGKTIL